MSNDPDADLTPVAYPKMIYRHPQKVSGAGGETFKAPIEGDDYKIAKNEKDEKEIRDEWNIDEKGNDKGEAKVDGFK